MIQQIIVLVLFLCAAGYIGRKIWKSFDSNSGCGKGCGCSTDKKLA
ncbi:FeoB-associated Cys-rich membrane protein [Dyadobacter sp. LHD-138]|nr:FeoB-associated Cys-rich membrane protein [Dyadobacter sp. LHD-138]MDQ6482188.1 FeoB-associated Cys-rich membrane protein [Dyadobacter sp. LHD-138]